MTDENLNQGLEDTRKMFPREFSQLAALYLRDSRERIEQLRQAATAGDLAQLARLAHSLGGSCASIGASRLATLCNDFELQCKTQQIDHIDAILTTIAAEFSLVECRLRIMTAAEQ